MLAQLEVLEPALAQWKKQPVRAMSVATPQMLLQFEADEPSALHSA